MRLPAVLHPERLAAVRRGSARNGDAVLEKHAVELAALGHARHVGEQAEVEIGFADRVGMAPTCRMAAGNAEKSAKPQLALTLGHRSPSRKSSGKRYAVYVPAKPHPPCRPQR